MILSTMILDNLKTFYYKKEIPHGQVLSSHGLAVAPFKFGTGSCLNTLDWHVEKQVVSQGQKAASSRKLASKRSILSPLYCASAQPQFKGYRSPKLLKQEDLSFDLAMAPKFGFRFRGEEASTTPDLAYEDHLGILLRAAGICKQIYFLPIRRKI